MNITKFQLLETIENKVLNEFARLLGVTKTQITAKNSCSHITDIRHLYCKLRYDMHGNYSKIGREIGRTHTSVRYGVKRINDLLSIEDLEIVTMWNKVKNILEFYYDPLAS